MLEIYFQRNPRRYARYVEIKDYINPWRYVEYRLRNDLEEGGGDVGGGNEGVEELDYDTLLACYASHAATDTLELALGDTHLVVGLEGDGVGGDEADVFVLGVGGEDEIAHLPVADRQGRVAEIHAYLEMVVVEGEVGKGRTVVDIGAGLLLGEVGEDEVGDQRLGVVAELAINATDTFPHSYIGINAIEDELIDSHDLAPVGGTEHKPFLLALRVGDIFHRHPFLRMFGFGEGEGCNSNAAAMGTADGVFHIRQCAIIFDLVAYFKGAIYALIMFIYIPLTGVAP